MSLFNRMAALSAVLLLTGCGTATAGQSKGQSPGVAGGSSGTVQSPSPSAGAAASRAVSVTFERGGGKTGVMRISRFAAGSRLPAGTRPQQRHAVLTAASAPGLRTLHLPRQPQALCCDRFTYTISITWADGKKRVFRTADGLHQPPPLRRLLASLS